MQKRIFGILLTIIWTSISFGQATVHADYETDPVLNVGDVADDPAIWIHPTFPDSSFFIGTDKSSNGRLELYNFNGERFDHTPTGVEFNNVDLTYNFSLSGETVDLVAGSNRTDDKISIFKVDVVNRTLIDITGNTSLDYVPYGVSFYRDLENGKYYVFTSKRNDDSIVQQFELSENNGNIDASLVRTIPFLSLTEGLVVDDFHDSLYVSEEDEGVWKFGARPSDDTEGYLMDTTDGPNLSADVEGLCIYYKNEDSGYLIVSSQGSSEYIIYDRESNNYIDKFTITAGVVNGAQETDGIDVISYPFSLEFPDGVFIAHDGENDGENSNFKIVDWKSIADSLNLPSASFDPRYEGNPSEVGDYPRQEVLVYPNPLLHGNMIYLKFSALQSNLELRVFDIHRREVKSLSLDKGLFDMSIQIDGLRNGVYFIQIQSSTSLRTEKIVINR